MEMKLVAVTIEQDITTRPAPAEQHLLLMVTGDAKISCYCARTDIGV